MVIRFMSQSVMAIVDLVDTWKLTEVVRVPMIRKLLEGV